MDVCFARAFSSLEGSWEAARSLLQSGGRLVYFAGPAAVIPEGLPGASAIDRVRGLESSGPLVIICRT